ncbi:cupredoxin domain-containing protein [Patescibacteria group bacterium AH-259-L07]|nr:cupredoxin domain-containing protein [Patescibacteria group bacterium AH-259-L07]
MKQSTVWTIVIIIILVVLGILLIGIPKGKVPEGAVPETSETEQTVTEKDEAARKQELEKKVKQAKEVVPGGSLVTKEGEVISETGETVISEALPGSSTAPKQSRVLQEEEIPEEAIRLTLSTDRRFEPDEFTVAADSVVTLFVTSEDTSHVLKFEDDELQAIGLGLRIGQTKAVTFKAPAKGDYAFFCGMHEEETGVMHVK